MGSDVVQGVPVLKGPVPHCLERVSKGKGARARLQQLAAAVQAIAPQYRGLENVLDENLLIYVFNEKQRKVITEHLRRNWFDDNSPDAFFPGQPVASIYAKGLLKALELSLSGRRVIPIKCWWIVDCVVVTLLTLAEVQKRGPSNTPITLIILTPRPNKIATRKVRAILGNEGKAWVSRSSDGRITTTQVR
ncbi:MAG TPA: hypothetical protein VLX09_11190 [Stellaceae bacterium]|nr:hypothetical protein [Stellaceae bacterium]